MDKQIIERAVEAAAKADYEVLRRGHWDEQPDDFRDEWRSDVRPLVTAALAEMEASITAERDRLAERLDKLLGVADEDGVTYPPNEFQRALRRYAAFEYDNLVAERDDLAARVARVEALHRVNTTPCIECGVVHEWCVGCAGGEAGEGWPCPTIKALRDEDQ